MSQYKFFWSGPFSQWFKSSFVIDGKIFNTCEQWMMWNKAMLFQDTEIADAILATSDSKKQKAKHGCK